MYFYKKVKYLIFCKIIVIKRFSKRQDLIKSFVTRFITNSKLFVKKCTICVTATNSYRFNFKLTSIFCLNETLHNFARGTQIAFPICIKHCLERIKLSRLWTKMCDRSQMYANQQFTEGIRRIRTLGQRSEI